MVVVVVFFGCSHRRVATADHLIHTQLGTGFNPDALLDTTLPLYPSLGLALHLRFATIALPWYTKVHIMYYHIKDVPLWPTQR